MKRTPLKRKTPLKAKAGRQRKIDQLLDGDQWTEREKAELARRSKLKTKKPMKKKAAPGANSAIRKSAEGKPCLVRLPGICNCDPATTVAAHIRIPGTCGVGNKPSDLLTVRACSACHDEMDRRTRRMDKQTLTICVHEAHCRTLVEYEKEGLIRQ